MKAYSFYEWGLTMNWKSRSGGFGNSQGRRVVSMKWMLMLCILSFCAGLLFTNRLWSLPEAQDTITTHRTKDFNVKLTGGCDSKSMNVKRYPKVISGQTTKDNSIIHALNKSISNLEIELAAAKATQESIVHGTPLSNDLKETLIDEKRKYLMVVGINTAFSSRKRRDSVRATWMPQGDKRKMLEEEKGIIIRFVIGHGYEMSTSNQCK